jgi:hypothetical protein
MQFTAADKLFYGYMVLVGLIAGAVLIAAPQTADFVVKPYFWVLLAVALVDGVMFAMGRPPTTTISMQTRMIGFVVGVVLMVALARFGGSPAQFM